MFVSSASVHSSSPPSILSVALINVVVVDTVDVMESVHAPHRTGQVLSKIGAMANVDANSHTASVYEEHCSRSCCPLHELIVVLVVENLPDSHAPHIAGQ